jgi:hypothetical protein
MENFLGLGQEQAEASPRATPENWSDGVTYLATIRPVPHRWGDEHGLCILLVSCWPPTPAWRPRRRPPLDLYAIASTAETVGGSTLSHIGSRSPRSTTGRRREPISNAAHPVASLLPANLCCFLWRRDPDTMADDDCSRIADGLPSVPPSVARSPHPPGASR